MNGFFSYIFFNLDATGKAVSTCLDKGDSRRGSPYSVTSAIASVGGSSVFVPDSAVAFSMGVSTISDSPWVALTN
jgi:hypothetical protein